VSGIAGIINWQSHSVEPGLLAKMIDIINHRGPNGLYQKITDHVGLGYAKLELNGAEASEIQPLWLPDKSCAIVADARLYNGKQLIENLGGFIDWCRAETSDAAIILSAYLKWGVNLLDRIDGDFAFAIWDSKKDRVFAAREPFGVKPFFYNWRSKCFIFGSEPKQILLHPEISTEPDNMIVGEYLFNNFDDINRTFFKQVSRLKPSHYLLATKNSVKQIRYWNPDPDNETIYPNPDDYLKRFKELFVDSVRKRLTNSHTVAAQLSGGG